MRGQGYDVKAVEIRGFVRREGGKLQFAHRRQLRSLMVLSITALLVLFYVFRNHQQIVLEKWHFALVLLPFFIIGMIQSLLMYDAWFVRGSKSALGTLKRVSFSPLR